MKRKIIIGAALVGAFVVGGGVGAAGGASKPKPVVHTVVQVQTQTVKVPVVKWHTRVVVKVKHVTSVVTHTVTNTVTTTPTYSTGSWPTLAEESFVKNTIDAGDTQDDATCQLKYIETHVSYDGFMAAQHDIAIGNYPSWYTGAANACGD